MNREIKFRGKKTSTGEWVYGYFAMVDDQPAILTDSIDWIDGSELSGICWDWVAPDTVGQFTGLLDANGLEIYEGDIVKSPLLDPIFGDILSNAFDNVAISFNNGSFVVAYYEGRHKIYLQDLYDKIEVIGNIHDNPELLKGGNQ